MIKSETVQVYNWFDIQNEICRVMGIEKHQFRRYHEVIGGEYLDLWQVALKSIIPDQMANETIVEMYSLDDHDYLIVELGEWTRPFFEAYHKVIKELDPEWNGVWVRFSW